MFTNNWFDITARANFEKYVPLATNFDGSLNFLEVGCYEGRASVWLLEHTQAELTVIDTFKGGEDLPNEQNLFDRFTENIKPYMGRVEIKEGASRYKLKEFLSDTFDFIYIDGSHLAKNVLEDAVLAFPLLKEGGIMIFDDYTWGAGMHYLDVPRTGIDAFLLVYSNQLEILEKNSQAIIRKKAMPHA